MNGTLVEDARGNDSPAHAGTRLATLRDLVRGHGAAVVLTLALFNLENVVRLAQPWALGWAVGDALQGSAAGFWAFASQQLVSVLLCVWRRAFDTRLYTRMYADFAARVV